MKISSFKYFLLLGSFYLFSCNPYEDQKVIKLWGKNIPNSIKNQEYKEVTSNSGFVISSIEQVSQPTLTVFKPEISNGTAVIICPGGGYRLLAINKEGYKVAEWLNTLGVTAFVLKYRLPSDAIMKNKEVGPLQDAQRAIRYVRRNARNWNLNTDKIGVIGFSAGGHLAATLSTQYNKDVYEVKDNMSARPDFSILIYPVISMRDSIAHKGSKKNLLGDSPSLEKANQYSNEVQVDALTPKTFLTHAKDDKSVPIENSLQYYSSLKKHQILAEIHIYEKGGHGFGLGRSNINHPWTKACESWLITNNLL